MSEADGWLAGRNDYSTVSVRFDIVAVIPEKWPVHIEDAF
jgi:putative endonuclease